MRALLLLLTFSVISCVSYPRQIETVDIDHGYDLPLFKRINIESFTALQELTIIMDEQKFSFKMQIEILDGEIILIGLTPVHSRSFLITYKDGIIDYEEHPFFRYPLSPEQMIADIQMANLPFTDWQKQLNESEISLVKEGKKTVFMSGSEKLVSIEKSQSTTTLIHHGYGCEIQIKNLSYEKL